VIVLDWILVVGGVATVVFFFVALVDPGRF